MLGYAPHEGHKPLRTGRVQTCPAALVECKRVEEAFDVDDYVAVFFRGDLAHSGGRADDPRLTLIVHGTGAGYDEVNLR
jgi:hypothetical protein